jgi:hypothetical protein
MKLTVTKIGLALLLAAPAARLLAADELPKAETILDKYVEATGGKAAYDKLHNIVTTGSMSFGAMGIKATVSSYHAVPNKTYTEINIEGMGKIQDGTDGTVAWSLSAMQGPHIKDGEEKAQAMREADFRAETDWKREYKEVKTEAVETVDGKDCYKVIMTPNTGSPATRYYDKQTFLLVKVAMTAKTPMGDIPVESVLEDYRKEGDILMPHKTTLKQGGQEFSITIDTVKYNVDIPPETFALPAEIQALLKK